MNDPRTFNATTGAEQISSLHFMNHFYRNSSSTDFHVSTVFSALLYLNDDFLGGDFFFADRSFEVEVSPHKH